MDSILKKIYSWRSPQKHYFEYIDGNLVYHLYLRYRDHTEEVYHEDTHGRKEYNWGKWGLTPCSGWQPAKEAVWLSPIDNAWHEYGELKCMPCVFIEKTYSNRKELEKALPTLKYVYPDNDDINSLWEFINILIRYPEMELIYKNQDTRFLWRETRLYKLDKDKKHRVMEYLRLYASGMWCQTYNEILWCATHPSKRTKEAYEEHLRVQRINRISKRLDPNYVLKRYSKQIKKHGMPKFVMLYKEYLRMARKLKINNLYPRDIEKSHDEVSNSLALVANKKRLISSKTYKKYLEAVKKLPVKCKKITLYIPKITGDLVVLGNKLHNCVGSCGYDESVIKGESLIVEVRHEDKPVECCEIDLHKMKIEQLYGDHNSSNGKYHNIARNYINAFIREIRA